MNDEVPDEGDFDANRHRGEFDDITPEDFIRGMGNPPGWLPSDEINRVRREIPIPYVVVVPVRTDDLGRVAQIGSLLRVTDDGGIERTLIAGRVLYHESLREAVARNVAKDLGDIALPQLPISLQPFTVAEQFTGVPGVMVTIEETIRGFKMILDGEVDYLPEPAFLNVGTIDEVIEKAKTLKDGE